MPFAGIEIGIDGDLDRSMHAPQGTTLIDLEAEVTLEITGPKGTPPARFPPVRAQHARWLIDPRQGHVQVRSVFVPVSREQLDVIESWRSQDIECEIGFCGRLLEYTKGNNGDISMKEVYQKIPHTIPHSVWVRDFLERIGYATYHVLEMRLDRIEGHEDLQRAAQHLDDALSAFHNGRVQEPIGDVRQAMEAIESTLQSQQCFDEYAKRILAKGRQATSRPQHDNANDPEPTRADAEIALHIGRATLRWASIKLAERTKAPQTT